MLESIFGLPVKYETWNKKNTMPLYIAGGYDFRTAYIADKRCIMIKPTEELAALPALKKQIVRIQETDHVPVVLELSTISAYRRKSLIENHIPFITKNRYFFLLSEPL